MTRSFMQQQLLVNDIPQETLLNVVQREWKGLWGRSVQSIKHKKRKRFERQRWEVRRGFGASIE
jgi:hypothetical protein